MRLSSQSYKSSQIDDQSTEIKGTTLRDLVALAVVLTACFIAALLLMIGFDAMLDLPA